MSAATLSGEYLSFVPVSLVVALVLAPLAAGVNVWTAAMMLHPITAPMSTTDVWP